mmetsp:Transcript_20251/g.65253  ORF Transcript_20251/g.65253 Transcript_20251/m.65253 type:complete len:168 (+) Transcript_20251:2-505(+)
MASAVAKKEEGSGVVARFTGRDYDLEVEAGDASWTVRKRYVDLYYLRCKVLGRPPLEEADLKAWFLGLLPQARLRQHVSLFLEVPYAERRHPGSLRKTGYLTKLGGNKSGGPGNWRRRYFVLADDLAYYDTEDALLAGAQPKGKVDLNTLFCPQPPQDDDDENAKKK